MILTKAGWLTMHFTNPVNLTKQKTRTSLSDTYINKS